MEIDPMYLTIMLQGRIDRVSVENKSLSLPKSVVRAVSDRVKQQYRLRKHQKQVFDRRLKEYISNYRKKQGVRTWI